MLLVNAKKGPSKIHGIGLIAHQFIPRGTITWKFQEGFDLRISRQLLEQLSPHAREQVLFYSYYDPRTRLYILSSDDDRFTNHSDFPNIEEHEDGESAVAKCDISDGDEITWNYREWVSEIHAHTAGGGDSCVEGYVNSSPWMFSRAERSRGDDGGTPRGL